ncbi:MAG: hypothetical protein QXP42_02015 [Candidatus Micrarchaeia archaeon]
MGKIRIAACILFGIGGGSLFGYYYHQILGRPFTETLVVSLILALIIGVLLYKGAEGEDEAMKEDIEDL